jgi:hypothetical protein
MLMELQVVFQYTGTTASVSSTGVVSGVGTGSATLVYTVTNGCGSIATSAVISVLPLPNAGLISGTGSVCVGSLLPLPMLLQVVYGMPAMAIHQYLVPVSLLVLTPGTDTILYTVTNSCASAVAKQIVLVIRLQQCRCAYGELPCACHIPKSCLC